MERNNDKDKYMSDFLRYGLPVGKKKLLRMVNDENLILFSNDSDELKRYKASMKDFKQQKIERLSIIGVNETVGLVESVLDCPYWTSTVTCTSNHGVYYQITKEDLFRRIDIFEK